MKYGIWRSDFDALPSTQVLRSLLSCHETAQNMIENCMPDGVRPLLHFGICKVSSNQLDWPPHRHILNLMSDTKAFNCFKCLSQNNLRRWGCVGAGNSHHGTTETCRRLCGLRISMISHYTCAYECELPKEHAEELKRNLQGVSAGLSIMMLSMGRCWLLKMM